MPTDPILQFMNERRGEMLALLRRLVEQESPTSNKAAVDACLDLIGGEVERLGGRVKRHRARQFGDHLEAGFDFGAGRGRGRGRLLVLGHADTVWELGTLARMPFRVKDGRAYGPGTLDMKAGITAAVFALRALHELGLRPRNRVALLLNSDEEVGSPSSRAITERLARGAKAVLVVEPGAGPRGALKTARKGVGQYRVEVHGQAAHAGVDFTKGASAIVEMGRQIARIAGFTRLKRGITVNPGVIGGGTRSNVIAGHAWAEVDVRIARLADAGYIERRFWSLRPFGRRTRVEVAGGLNRPPMERTPAIAALFRGARDIGKSLGLELEESSTGGGSDGNFTAALGVPTLDGLGGVGEGAHAAHEHILLEPFPARAALLAHLLLSL